MISSSKKLKSVITIFSIVLATVLQSCTFYDREIIEESLLLSFPERTNYFYDELVNTSHKKPTKYYSDKPNKLCHNLVKKITPTIKYLMANLEKPLRKNNIFNKISKFTEESCKDDHLGRTLKTLVDVVNQHKDKVGVLIPLSGEKSKYGKYFLEGVNLNRHENDLFIVRDSGNTDNQMLSSLANLVLREQVSILVGGLMDREAEILVDISRNLSIPTLMLNKNRKYIHESYHTFQVYPNEGEMAKSLSSTIKSQNIKELIIMKPLGGKSDQIIQLLKKNIDPTKTKVFDEISYISGNFKSMDAAVVDLSRYAKEKLEKFQLTKKNSPPKKEPIKNPHKNISQALFIPDNFRILHHFIGLFKYHKIQPGMPLLGNQQWRSLGLLEKWNPYLEGSFFADYIGPYNQLPYDIFRTETNLPVYFLPTTQTQVIDLKLLGYKASIIALEGLSGRSKRSHLFTDIYTARTRDSFFKNHSSFHSDKTSKWPSYIFHLSKGKIRRWEEPGFVHNVPIKKTAFHTKRPL